MENTSSPAVDTQKEAIAQPGQELLKGLAMLQGLPGAKSIIENTLKEAEKVLPGVAAQQKNNEGEKTEQGAGNEQTTNETTSQTRSKTTNQTNTSNAEEGNEGSEDGGEGGENTGKNENTEQAKKSLLFGDKGKGKGKPQKELSFESVDDFKQLAKELGVDVKEPKDFAKFRESVKKFRADSQKLKETQEAADGYKNILETLDPGLLEAVKAYHRGEDWKKAIDTAVPFDLSKPVEKQDTRKLVEHFFPGEFEEADFEATEKPKALLIAEKSAQEKFIATQKARNDKSAEEIKKAQDRLALRKASIDSSLSELQQSFPDLDITVVDTVKKRMESGDVMGMFFNSDGTFKPTAAKAMMLAEYGEQELKYMVEAAKIQVESNVMEEIATRGSDRKKPSGTGPSAGAKISKETQEQLAVLKNLGGKGSTF